MELKRCIRCTLPITWETLYFDDDGVCNLCHNWDIKSHDINWDEREKQLVAVFDDVKKQNLDYDCIVPFSGGKDSTFTLYTLIRKYGLKPLVISFDHGFYRPKTLDNRLKTFRKLGVDVITFTPNWHIVKKLMLESLIRKGDFCWHCHAGIFAYPMQMAVKLNIPLIIWGEGGGEYEAYFKFSDIEETDEWKFNRRIILGMRAEDMAGFIGVELRDLWPYVYPAKDEIEGVGIKSLPLGNFIKWDQQANTEIIKAELGWQEDTIESLPGMNFDKIECMFEGTRDYIKFLKRGFSRMTHRTSIDIRSGRISREKAMELIKEYEHRKPASLEVFLEYLNLSEAEFNEICLKHLIPPAPLSDPETLPKGDRLWDQDLWYRENGDEG